MLPDRDTYVAFCKISSIKGIDISDQSCGTAINFRSTDMKAYVLWRSYRATSMTIGLCMQLTIQSWQCADRLA